MVCPKTKISIFLTFTCGLAGRAGAHHERRKRRNRARARARRARVEGGERSTGRAAAPSRPSAPPAAAPRARARLRGGCAAAGQRDGGSGHKSPERGTLTELAARRGARGDSGRMARGEARGRYPSCWLAHPAPTLRPSSSAAAVRLRRACLSPNFWSHAPCWLYSEAGQLALRAALRATSPESLRRAVPDGILGLL